MQHEGNEFDLLLNQLGDKGKPLRLSRLPALSDLYGERLNRFCAAYDAYGVEGRRRLLRSLLELAESRFEVNFDAIFRHALNDSDASARAMAVEGLWEDSSPALISPLVGLLRADPSPRARAAAATGLGRFVLAGQLEELDAARQAQILEVLLSTVNLSGEELEVRRRALESAAYAGSPEVADLLEAAYDQEDEEMRLSAVLGMGRTCDKRWESIIVQELESGTGAMRYEAIVACGELGLSDSVFLLGGMIRDPDRQVSEAAIWALGQIGGQPARDLLLDAYEDADEDAQAAIDEALAELAFSSGASAFDHLDADGAEDLEILYEAEDEESLRGDPEQDDPSRTEQDT